MASLKHLIAFLSVIAAAASPESNSSVSPANSRVTALTSAQTTAELVHKTTQQTAITEHSTASHQPEPTSHNRTQSDPTGSPHTQTSKANLSQSNTAGFTTPVQIAISSNQSTTANTTNTPKSTTANTGTPRSTAAPLNSTRVSGASTVLASTTSSDTINGEKNTTNAGFADKLGNDLSSNPGLVAVLCIFGIILTLFLVVVIVKAIRSSRGAHFERLDELPMGGMTEEAPFARYPPK